ncbi:MAG: Nramp family divalent metal transporter, partial [Patescibacteria group bacterium]
MSDGVGIDMAQKLKEFPKVITLRRMLGPSFIILALGLGSGEIILWPYLSANFGLGIAWGAVLGITCQYFINMEIERYALVKGESVFVGLNKRWSLAPWWFILSTFIGFGLPGIIAASAQIFSFVFGVTDFKWTAIVFLILVGLILSVSKTVYAMMEHITKTIIFLGIPFILILTFIIARDVDWFTLGQGIFGIGDGFLFWPADMSLAVFLGAFAYAGAGGNLNLTQSIYIREKGYGMGYHAQKNAGLFRDIRERQT